MIYKAGCLLVVALVSGCSAMRQEVAINLQLDPSMPRRTGKIDVTVYLVR